MMEKVLLAALVVMLACSPAIGADTSNLKGKDVKVVKIYVHQDTGQIVGVKLKKDSGPDQDATMVSTTTPGTLIGTILFHKSSPGCTIIIAGSDAWQVCYSSLKVPMKLRTR